MNLNQSIFQYLNNLANKAEWFDDIIVFFAKDFGYLLILLFIAILIFDKKLIGSKKKIFLFAAASVFLSRLVITEIIRALYYSPRPFAIDSVNQLLIHDYTASFPSGHAAFFFALAMAIYLNRRRTSVVNRSPSSVLWPIFFFLGAILIGLARVIAGIHWPLDILAGAIVGTISTLVIYSLFKKRLQKSLENPIINSNVEI